VVDQRTRATYGLELTELAQEFSRDAPPKVITHLGHDILMVHEQAGVRFLDRSLEIVQKSLCRVLLHRPKCRGVDDHRHFSAVFDDDGVIAAAQHVAHYVLAGAEQLHGHGRPVP
jgi:hypothetical protein